MADLNLVVREDPPLELQYVEAKIKPEQSKTVTPKYEAQTVLPDPGMTLSSVKVEAIPDPTEEMEITKNGHYNVARIGTVDVDVPQGVFPTGTLNITRNGIYNVIDKEAVDVDVRPEGTTTIIEDGTYDVSEYATAIVNTAPEQGILFEEFDADGRPTAVRTVGMTTLGAYFLQKSTNWATAKIDKITINNGVTTLSSDCFRSCPFAKIELPSTVTAFGMRTFYGATALEEVVFNSNVSIGSAMFSNCGALKRIICNAQVTSFGQAWTGASMELYDFSHCTYVPALTDRTAFGYSAGCVIRVPADLLDDWKNSTNWSALPTDPTADRYVVWEGV